MEYNEIQPLWGSLWNDLQYLGLTDWPLTLFNKCNALALFYANYNYLGSLFHSYFFFPWLLYWVGFSFWLDRLVSAVCSLNISKISLLISFFFTSQVTCFQFWKHILVANFLHYAAISVGRYVVFKD